MAKSNDTTQSSQNDLPIDPQLKAAEKPVDDGPIGNLRDDKIHFLHYKQPNRLACGRDAVGRVTVRDTSQLDQATCKQCVSTVQSKLSEYEGASAKFKNDRKKIRDTAAMQALSTDDEDPKLLGNGR